ncbi:MAG: hypothetical protein A2Z99_15995 [Treponema sp. GWB1_62_6]|nr:MAG: hypothetical protein A2001_17840 [Treponema sp. GWC1_61_84]OHE65186.1 MAG: hypothetical protein A2Z99_15995 [Treponema sp. GWB1_62_6]OHE72467.1 MAG: hypothetical protein A2413_03835 [Treponema sp. RIFOXYC1_FULL_61_9]
MALLLVFVLAVSSVVASVFAWRNRGNGINRSTVDVLWRNSEYESVFGLSSEALAAKPLDPYWLVLNGFSAYQLAAAQTGAEQEAAYIDACIRSLRKAMLVGAGRNEAGVRYVLGKAYYQKGEAYAELAVDQFELARSVSYRPADLDEYLGLSYAALGKYRESVIAFSRALGDDPSDLLILAIARSYTELGENDAAKAYLVRLIENSKDIAIIIKSRTLLGRLFLAAGELDAAELHFLAALEADDSNADAHLSLGDLFDKKGDAIKARAEWRKSIRIDPANENARSRLSS